MEMWIQSLLIIGSQIAECSYMAMLHMGFRMHHNCIQGWINKGLEHQWYGAGISILTKSFHQFDQFSCDGNPYLFPASC